MKILIRNSDNVVIYAEDKLRLTENGLAGYGWRSELFTTSNARVELVSDLPEDWTGGEWAYTGGTWTLVDGTAAAARVAAKLEAQRTARREERKASAAGTFRAASGRVYATDADGVMRLLVAVQVLQARAVEKIRVRLADDTVVRADMPELLEVLDAVATRYGVE